MSKGRQLKFWMSILMSFLWTFSVFAFSVGIEPGDSSITSVDTLKKRSGFILQLTSDHFVIGNALNVDFYHTFLRGGNWSSNKNQRVLDALSFSNRSFFLSKTEFSFTESKLADDGKHSLNFRFQLGDAQYGHALFSGDLYRLATRGNAPYLGDTLRIGQNDLEQQHYRYFGIGVASRNSLDYAMLSYVDGLDFYRMRWNPGSFYTSSFGDTIAVDAQLNQWSNGGDRKGVGFKWDLRKSWVGKKYQMSVDVLDLGWVKWSGLEKKHWNVHETYTGIQWVDWIQLDDPLGENLDRWTSPEERSVSKWMALPTSIRMQAAWQVVRKWSVDFAFQRWIYQNQQGYRCLSVQRSWERFSLTRPDLHWRVSAYQSLSRQYWLGSDVSWTWLNGCSFQLQTYHVLSPARKASKQLGFALSFQYVFKGSANHQLEVPQENKKDEQQYFQF